MAINACSDDEMVFQVRLENGDYSDAIFEENSKIQSIAQKKVNVPTEFKSNATLINRDMSVSHKNRVREDFSVLFVAFAFVSGILGAFLSPLFFILTVVFVIASGVTLKSVEDTESSSEAKQEALSPQSQLSFVDPETVPSAG